MLYGSFASSIMGMYSQARSIENIGTNIANVNTGGYKRVDTHFSSLVSERFYNEGDLSGIKPKEYNRISVQGNLVTSDRELDLAINGQGFFLLNSQIDGNGDTYYGRDGSFHQENGAEVSVTETDGRTITIKEGYLADKNNLFVQGYTVATDGTVGTSLQSLRIDNWAYYSDPSGTSNATIHLNLPGNATVGDTVRYSAGVYDTLGEDQTVTFEFKKTAANTWSVKSIYPGPAVAQVDTISLGGTPQAGDIYTVSVNGTDFTYTATGAETGIDDVRTALMGSINAHATIGPLVTAAASTTSGQFTITADTAGTAFSSSTSATDGNSGQVDTVTLAGTPEAGDTYSVTVGGNTVTYNVTGLEADIDAIRDGLRAAINADPTVSAPGDGGGGNRSRYSDPDRPGGGRHLHRDHVLHRRGRNNR